MLLPIKGLPDVGVDPWWLWRGPVERMESLKWENKGGRTSSKRTKAQRESQSFWGISAQGWAGYLWQNSPLAQTDSKWPDVWEKWGLPTCKSFRGLSNSLITAEPPSSQFCSSQLVWFPDLVDPSFASIQRFYLLFCSQSPKRSGDQCSAFMPPVAESSFHPA